MRQAPQPPLVSDAARRAVGVATLHRLHRMALKDQHQRLADERLAWRIGGGFLALMGLAILILVLSR